MSGDERAKAMAEKIVEECYKGPFARYSSKPDWINFMASLIHSALTQAAPGWTKEKPTKPGWYFLRRSNFDPAQMVNVSYQAQDAPMVLYWGTGWDWLDRVKGEWSGPLEPPGDKVDQCSVSVPHPAHDFCKGSRP